MAEKFAYEICINKLGPAHSPELERLSLGGKCLFHQEGTGAGPSHWITEPELLHLPEPGPIALGRIPSISEIVIAYTVLTSGIGCYSFSDKVLSQKITHNTQPTSSSSSVGLDDDAGNYLSAIRDAVVNLQDLNVRKSILVALQHVNPSISSVELNDIQNPQNVVVGHRLNGKTLVLGLSQESDGFRRFYAHLLALYQRPPKQTLIFEHPEDGIHPGALSILAEEFKAAPDQGRGQVVLTTHSPKLLDAFDSEHIRVVELSGWETRIGSISTEQKEALHDGLLEPGELLTVDPARIEREAAGA
jgi:hypothetical protein